MRTYLMTRLVWTVPVLIGAVTVIFVIMQILPGDVALVIQGGDEGSRLSAEDLGRLRARMGLDRPIHVRYLEWLSGVARLDLGVSLWTGQPVIQEVGLRFPVSLQLVIMSVLLSALLAIPIGILSALKQDSFTDYALRSLLIGGLSIPNFWLGMLVILGLMSTFRWLPPLDYATIFTDPWVSFQQFIFPALVLGYRQTAVSARMTRSAMLEVLRADYVRTARSKGLREQIVVWRHAFGNAVLPVVTIFGLEMAVLFSGAVVIEKVFTLPGMGSFLVDAIAHRDVPVVQAVVGLIVLFVVAANLLVDLAYGFFDPRIRYR